MIHLWCACSIVTARSQRVRRTRAHMPIRGLRRDVDGARSITVLVEMHTLIQPHEHAVCSLCHMHFPIATALPSTMLSISPPAHMASGPSAQILTDTTRATRNTCPPRRPSKHIGRSTARQTRAHCLRRRRLTTTRVPTHRPINPTLGVTTVHVVCRPFGESNGSGCGSCQVTSFTLIFRK